MGTHRWEVPPAFRSRESPLEHRHLHPGKARPSGLLACSRTLPQPQHRSADTARAGGGGTVSSKRSRPGRKAPCRCLHKRDSEQEALGGPRRALTPEFPEQIPSGPAWNEEGGSECLPNWGGGWSATATQNPPSRPQLEQGPARPPLPASALKPSQAAASKDGPASNREDTAGAARRQTTEAPLHL